MSSFQVQAPKQVNLNQCTHALGHTGYNYWWLLSGWRSLLRNSGRGWWTQEESLKRGSDFPSVCPAVTAWVWMSRFFSHFLLPSLAAFSQNSEPASAMTGREIILGGKAAGWPVLRQRPPLDKALFCCSGQGLSPLRGHRAATLCSVFVAVFFHSISVFNHEDPPAGFREDCVCLYDDDETDIIMGGKAGR